MKRFVRLSSPIAFLLGLFFLLPSIALACSIIEPEWRVNEYNSGQIPACVQTEPSEWYASIEIKNGCDYEVVLTENCEGCQPVSHAPGFDGVFYLQEYRMNNLEAFHGEKTFEIQWEANDTSGKLSINATLLDRSKTENAPDPCGPDDNNTNGTDDNSTNGTGDNNTNGTDDNNATCSTTQTNAPLWLFLIAMFFVRRKARSTNAR